MKKPQWITVFVAIVLVSLIYLFARTTPLKDKALSTNGRQEDNSTNAITDSILNMAKSRISPDQLLRITTLENSISRGAVRKQRLDIYHQLAHFWRDTAHFSHPYAWYEAEGARLENSEKTLTFAARLFLDMLERERNPEFSRWEALQAKDLLERSLILNPDNDSAKVGIGACYLFGNISPAPMEGIAKIREVLDKDSTNIYALKTMAKALMISTQYDKAIARLLTVNRIQPDDGDAIFMLADLYERTNHKAEAIKWYRQSLRFVPQPEMKQEIEKRIEELKK